MKLKSWYLITAIAAGIYGATAAQAAAENPGLQYINARGEIRCGTNLTTKTFAYKDDQGQWRGIDADLCRMFSMAIFGESSHFKLINVSTDRISNALATNEVDIMLGNHSLPAHYELTSRANAVDPVYYDRQMLMAAEKPTGNSMEAFKGASVCAIRNSEDIANLKEYNRRYNLALKVLPFPNEAAAKEAFYLKRCKLLTGTETYLRGLAQTVVSRNVNPEILPETLAQRPVYAYVDTNNNKLRLISRWILNAPKLAEANGMTSKNVETFIGVTDTSTRNLLGADPTLWQRFGLQPDWVRKAVTERGNFGEMFENNLGGESALKMEREQNNLIQNGGLVQALSFL